MKTSSFTFQNARSARVADHFDRTAAKLACAALAASLALLSGCATAQTAETMDDCRAIEDNAERLACFDRMASTPPPAPPEAPAQSSQPPVAEAPPAQTTTPAPTAPPRAAEPADFGLERQASLEGPDSILASVVGGFKGWGEIQTKEGRKTTVFELDNGQIWVQVGPQKFRYGGPDRKVEIRRASFGSFLLSPEGLNRSVRVRRVK